MQTQTKYLYLMAAVHLSLDICTGSLPAVLPFFVSLYGMDYTSIAGLMFASSFLSSIIQPLFGLLADKTSFQWFMPVGLLLTGIPLALAGFTESYWLIFAAVTVSGIGAAIFHPEAARMVNSISGKQRGAGMSIFSVGGNSGFGLGPLLAVFLISTFCMPGLLFYGIEAILISLVLLAVVPRIKAFALELKAQQAAEAEADGVTVTEAEGTNDWPAFLRLTVVILCRSVVFAGLSSFLPLYCIQSLGATHATGSATLSVLALTGIIATLIGGRLADRFGYVTILRLGMLALVPFFAVAVFGRNLWLVYAMIIPMALCLHGTYSPFVVLGQSYLAKNVGFASGVTLGLAFSAGGIVVPTLGRYADAHGINAVMTVLVVIALGAGLATLILPQPKEK